jgi:hypothetical protein
MKNHIYAAGTMAGIILVLFSLLLLLLYMPIAMLLGLLLLSLLFTVVLLYKFCFLLVQMWRQSND